MKHGTLFILAIFLAAIVGCSNTRPARDVQPSGFLGADAKLLRKGAEGEAPLMYRKPGVDWGKYNKILLEPVTLWVGPDSNLGSISYTDRQMLINYFHQLIFNKFSRQFQMVNAPQEDTLRVRVAITKAEKSMVVLDMASTIIPQLHVLSGLKTLVTGKPAFVGEAAIAYKITDASNGDLLAEGVADRVGGKTLDSKHLKSWGDVEEAFKFWVNHAAYKLCELQKRDDCTKPESSSLL